MSDETPAETIRRAAALMRERVEAATPGPWLGVMGQFKDGDWPCVITPQGDPKDAETWLMGAGNGGTHREANAVHAGSWHPVVALAVAGWLDEAANAYDTFPDATPGHSLKVARAYLGEGGIVTIVLTLGLYALAMVFLFALCLTVAVVVVFREPALLGLAAIFAAITALLISAGVRLA